MLSHLALTSAAALALGLAAPAQDISITDANVTFTKDFHTSGTALFPGGAAVDFLRADAAGDAAGALFTSAWIYREASDTREFMFNDGGGQAAYNNAGNTGTATWADMDGRGLFSAVVTYTASSTGATSGVVVSEAAITNISAGPITLTIFHFADFDLCGPLFSSNVSTSGENRRQFHTSDCGETAEHFARLPDRWETQTSGNLYSRFGNTVIDTLVNNTGSVGPGDIRACYEWDDITIDPGATATLVTQMTHNHATPEIVINEFSYDDSGTDDFQFVELFNASPFAADIGDYVLESMDPFGTNFTTTIPTGTTLAAGDYYVLGDAGVPNVDQPIGANPENSEESLTIMTGNGVVLDSLVYEANKGVWDFSLAEGEGVWPNHFMSESTFLSASRYRDGLDTDDNGNDFGLLPWTPGASNNVLEKRSFKDNFDTASPGDTIDRWPGSFQPGRVIDPTTADAINPNAIAASPQGGNASIFWDESGGGNTAILLGEAGIETFFEAWVYIEGTVRGTTGGGSSEHETWSIGIQGSTGPFHNSPDPAQVFPFTANGNTGFAWIYHANNTDVNLYLVDMNNGGWGPGALTAPTILGTIPITAGSNDGWQRLLLDVTGTTLTARFGGTFGGSDGTLFSATVDVPVGGVYAGYREFITDNATARPLTMDNVCITFCPDAHVGFFGTATANTVDTPQIGVTGLPTLGGSISLTCSGLVPNQPAFLFAGFRLDPPFDVGALGGVPGSLLYVDVLTSTPANASGIGVASRTLNVINDRVLCGVLVVWQWFGLDPALGTTIQFANSQAATTTVGL